MIFFTYFVYLHFKWNLVNQEFKAYPVFRAIILQSTEILFEQRREQFFAFYSCLIEFFQYYFLR